MRVHTAYCVFHLHSKDILAFVYIVAGKFLLPNHAPLMNTFHVTIMCGVRSKRAPTVATFKWSLAAVLTNVSSENGRRCEGFHAVRALVRSLTAVYSHVLVQTRRLETEKCHLVFTCVY